MLGRASFSCQMKHVRGRSLITNLWSVIPEGSDKACHGNAENSFPGHLAGWWFSWAAHEDRNMKSSAPSSSGQCLLSGMKNILGARSQQRNDDAVGCGMEGHCLSFLPCLLFLRLNSQASPKGEDIPGIPGNHCQWWGIHGVYSVITLATMYICRQIFSHLYLNTLFMLQLI